MKLNVLCVVILTSCVLASANEEEDAAKKFLDEYDVSYADWMNKLTIVNWNYETNISNETLDDQEEIQIEVSRDDSKENLSGRCGQ